MNAVDGPDSDIAPSAEEYDAVKAALAAVVGIGRDGRAVSLNCLLARWSALADDVEEGYAWCAAEFENDLGCRNALAGVWPLLPPRVRSIRQPELDGIDRLYRHATVPWPGRPEYGAEWWRWRVPRHLVVEASEQRGQDWPLGWEMPFPRPTPVRITAWHSS